MMTAPAAPSYLQMPPRPAKYKPVTANPLPTPLTWVYDNESDNDSTLGTESNGEKGEHLEENLPAPDASGGRTAD